VFLRWFPCHGDRFPLRRDSHAHGSRNQTPALVCSLQVDERREEGGGAEEERQVRHRSLLSALWSQCRLLIRGRGGRNLFACESTDFLTTAAARGTERERKALIQEGDIFFMHSITWTLCSRRTLVHQTLSPAEQQA